MRLRLKGALRLISVENLSTGIEASASGESLNRAVHPASRHSARPVAQRRPPSIPISSHAAVIYTGILSNNSAWHGQRESVHYVGLRSLLGCGLAWSLARVCLAGGLPELVGGHNTARRENGIQRTGKDEHFIVVTCWDPNNSRTFFCLPLRPPRRRCCATSQMTPLTPSAICLQKARIELTISNLAKSRRWSPLIGHVVRPHFFL